MENHVISSGQTVNLRSDTFTMWKRTILKITCFAIPVLLLIGAYFHMAIRYEKIWLFDTIVHERGKYTLWEVIFYFRHFLWELPMKTVYSFLLIGIFYYFGNPLPNNVTDASKPLIPNNRLILSGLFVLAIGGFSFLMAANELGYKEA